MAIKTLLDCCTSFHSFKTDKKKFQVGHVTPKHQAMNKPSPHTAVGARPACPPWQGWLLPLTWEIISQLQQILFSLGGCTGEPDRTGSSALPGPAGSWSTGQSRVPLQRSSWRGCRGSSVPALALCPCPGSVPLPWLCPAARLVLFAACSSFLPWHSWGTTQLSSDTHPGFSASLCSALCLLSCSSQGKGGKQVTGGVGGKGARSC